MIMSVLDLLVPGEAGVVGLVVEGLGVLEGLDGLGGELHVEVRGVGLALDLGHEGRLDALVVDVLPVDLLEPGVALDLLGAREAQPLLGVLGEEPLEHVHQLGRELSGERGTSWGWRARAS